MVTDDGWRIRALGGDDLATMRALNRVFARAFEDEASYRPAPGDDWLRRVLARPEVIVLVAEAEGMVIGGLVAYDLPKLEQERSEIYLYDLAVDAAHRRRGVARALIAALQRIAADRDAWVIFVQADPGDDPAIRLYSSLGAREDVLHFDIPPRPAD